MKKPLTESIKRRVREETTGSNNGHVFWRFGAICLFTLALPAANLSGQAITIDSQGNVSNGHSSTVDRRFAQIQPTHVTLTQSELDAKTRLELIRVLQAEQGFAMRPFPRGRKGLTLVANGELKPAGEDYLNMITSAGTCAKPGDRLVLTDVKIDRSKIVFDLNGGPDEKHRFLRHIQIGSGPVMNPVVQGDEQEATGARLTLEFKGHVPELTGADVKALLSPLISFDVKTPIQAFTDTLPPKLKEAILNHHVMVGMSTDMVLFAKGQPETKTREMEGQMPFEEWIYGRPPKDVEFIRINGNRVIRVEVAKIGEPPLIYSKDEVEGLMRTDGTPLIPGDDSKTHTVQMGDVEKNPDTQAPAAPPSLRNPGEQVPADKGGRVGEMKPVQFPKSKPDDEPVATPDSQPAPPLPAGTTPAKPGSTSGDSQPATDASQKDPAKPNPDPNQTH
jgi:hypothetical protein